MGKLTIFRTRAVVLGALATSLLGAATPGLADDAGKAMFMANCSACHRADGKGVPHAFPALAGDPFVVGPKGDPITRVLNGRGGMPSFKGDLSDDQIAGILTYVRSAWGNKAGPVSVGDVAAIRKSGGAVIQARGLQAH
jgi:cytochrome c6